MTASLSARLSRARGRLLADRSQAAERPRGRKGIRGERPHRPRLARRLRGLRRRANAEWLPHRLAPGRGLGRRLSQCFRCRALHRRLDDHGCDRDCHGARPRLGLERMGAGGGADGAEALRDRGRDLRSGRRLGVARPPFRCDVVACARRRLTERRRFPRRGSATDPGAVRGRGHSRGHVRAKFAGCPVPGGSRRPARDRGGRASGADRARRHPRVRRRCRAPARDPARPLPGGRTLELLRVGLRPGARAVSDAFVVPESDSSSPASFRALVEAHVRHRALASFALLVLAPVLVVAALLVATTRGPIVFRQTRIGERGRLFTIYKFRTMRADAEQAGGAVWASAGDPRATRIGSMLRRTHLDELPQLLNVLRGDMSIVGPRPERPEFVELLEAVVPSWRRRLLVKPGITGWAQVRSGYAADPESTAVKLSYDLWYLRHRNLVIDLAVCAKTFFIVLGLRQREPRVEPTGSRCGWTSEAPDSRHPECGRRSRALPHRPGCGQIRPGRPPTPERSRHSRRCNRPRRRRLPRRRVRPPTYRVPARSGPGLHVGAAPRGPRPTRGEADRAGSRHLPQPTTVPEPVTAIVSTLRSSALLSSRRG